MTGKRYRVLQTLGRGAFGTVYRAELLGAGDFKKEVALKVLDHQGPHAEEIALRFRDEARILGLIHHRAVVGVDELVELENGWAVAMEYVEGVDVRTLVKTGPPPLRAVVQLVEEVASALHAAWSAPSDSTGAGLLHVVHRDIKPANIRVTLQGDVKVLDFGVARAEFDAREADTDTVRFGSLRYMAPEAFRGVEDHTTDVFALGVVFGELLAAGQLGEPPRDPESYGDFVNEVGRLVCARQPDETDRLDDALTLLSAMIAFEPGERPAARDVEVRCRALVAGLEGATLRGWAEKHVPALLAERSPPRAVSSESVATILMERARAPVAELLTLPPATTDAPVRDDDGPGAAFAALVAVTVMLLVGGAWLVLQGW